MACSRFAVVLSLFLTVGCAPKPPTSDAFSQVLKKIVPSVSTAETVAVVASSPTSADAPSDFTVKVANALAERIATGGLPSGTHPKVRVHRTSDEALADDAADVTFYLQLSEQKLEGEFAADRAEMSKRFKANSWIYARDTDTTFTMSTGFDSSQKANGPEGEVTPTWESFGYPSDSDERLHVFAGECADSILKTYHDLSSRLDESK